MKRFLIVYCLLSVAVLVACKKDKQEDSPLSAATPTKPKSTCDSPYYLPKVIIADTLFKQEGDTLHEKITVMAARCQKIAWYSVNAPELIVYLEGETKTYSFFLETPEPLKANISYVYKIRTADDKNGISEKKVVVVVSQ